MIKPNIIEAKFLRRGSKVIYTKLWKNVDSPVKENITTQVSFLENETAILIYLEVNNYWWLLTNERLIVFEAGKLNPYYLSAINNVDTDVFNGKATKEECVSVQLTINKNMVNLLTENRTWPVIFTILQFISQKGIKLVSEGYITL